MKNHKLLLTALFLMPALALADGNDFLTQQQIRIDGPNADQVVSQTTADVMGVFDHFQPLLDSDSNILSPLKVRGSKSNPVVQLSVQKCMLGLACESVSLVGEVTLQPSKGACARNYNLHIDLSRSSEALAATYDALDGDLCYQKNASGGGTLNLSQSAHRGSRFEAGSLQQQILGFMKQQAPQITRAFQAAIHSAASDPRLAKAN